MGLCFVVDSGSESDEDDPMFEPRELSRITSLNPNTPEHVEKIVFETVEKAFKECDTSMFALVENIDRFFYNYELN